MLTNIYRYGELVICASGVSGSANARQVYTYTHPISIHHDKTEIYLTILSFGKQKCKKGEFEINALKYFNIKNE